MAAQARAILVKKSKVVVAQLADSPECYVVGTSGVSLGQHEMIGWVEDLVVKNQQQVKAREIAPDVPDTALEVHPEQPEPSTASQLVPRAGGVAREPVTKGRFPKVGPFPECRDLTRSSFRDPCGTSWSWRYCGRVASLMNQLRTEMRTKSA